MSYLERRFVAVLCVLILVFGSEVMAQTPQSQKPFGRLSDGRAYRINQDGYRLVDHIAELEVELDDLKRQNFALENEVMALRGDTPAGAHIDQSDLRVDVDFRADTVSSPARESLCETLLLPLQKRIAELESKLENPSVCAPSHVDLGVEKSLKEKISQLEDTLALRPSEESVKRERASYKQDFSELSNKLAKNRSVIQAREAQLAEGQKREEALRQEIETLNKKLAMAEESLQKSLERYAKAKEEAEKARASLSRPAAPRKMVQAVSSVPTSTGRVASGELKRQLSKIQKLIGERKSLLDALKKSSRGIVISVQPLVSSSGFSLDNLRGRAKDARASNEVAEIDRGLKSIEKKLIDDVQTLRRLTRS